MVEELVDQKIKKIVENYQLYREIDIPTENKLNAINDLTLYYFNIYQHNSRELAPLFRTMYQAFDLISRSGMNYEEQCNYSKLARASLNEDVIRLLMLNGLSTWGDQFTPLIEKYGLLKHIDADGYGAGYGILVTKVGYDWCSFEEFGYRSCCYDPKTGKRLSDYECQENLANYERSEEEYEAGRPRYYYPIPAVQAENQNYRRKELCNYSVTQLPWT